MRRLTLIAFATLVAACGDTSNGDGRTGTGGTGGPSGMAGSGGTAGMAGAGGTSGSSGTAGAGGMAGGGGLAMCSESADCEDGDECTEDACDVDQGLCEQTVLAEGAVCDFGGAAGVCQTGLCSADYYWRTPGIIEGEVGRVFHSDVAFKPDGDAVVVWYQQGETELNIWAVEYSRTDGWATPQRIGPIGFGDSHNPRIAFDSNGDGMAVWRQREGSGFNIWANRYTKGQGFGTAQPIGDSGGSSASPQFAMNAKGDAVATWRQNNTIWAVLYTKATGWGVAGPIVDAQQAAAPVVDIGVNGNAVTVWSDDNDIYASRYGVGSGWSEAVLIENNSGDAYASDIAVDADGNATAVWYQSTSPSSLSVFTNRYTVGQGWGSDQRMELTPDSISSEPKVGVDPAGNVIAVWQLGIMGRYSVRANRYTTGDGWGVAEQISEWGDYSWGISGPELAVDRNGSAIVVWNTRYDGRHATYSNRFTKRFGWGTAQHIDDSNPDRFSQYVAVDVDQEGRAIAVWRRGPATDERDLWANRFE